MYLRVPNHVYIQDWREECVAHVENAEIPAIKRVLRILPFLTKSKVWETNLVPIAFLFTRIGLQAQNF